MNPGQVFIKEENGGSIGIYRHQNKLENGKYVDEYICSLHSVDLLDVFLQALNIDFDKMQETPGYPIVLEDDRIDEETFDQMEDM